MSRCEKGWGPDLGRVFKCFYKGKQGQAWNGVAQGGSVVEETSPFAVAELSFLSALLSTPLSSDISYDSWSPITELLYA